LAASAHIAIGHMLAASSATSLFLLLLSLFHHFLFCVFVSSWTVFPLSRITSEKRKAGDVGRTVDQTGRSSSPSVRSNAKILVTLKVAN